jgi:mono/diheme cytochrome c family protein
MGVVLILGALIVGAVIAIGLYQWEKNDRAAQASLFPTATPLPAAATPTATAALAVNNQASATTSNAATTSTGAKASGDAAAGGKVFAANCTGCHPGGKAGLGPALSGPQFSAKYPDDAAITKMIRTGQGGMPAFPATKLSDGDLNDLLAYLHSL